MTQALYRRYRPQTFSEIVGQHHVADTLRNALQQGRVGHAYLFTGPRGTGKTSTARIMAKAVNCLAEDIGARPDNTCAICTAINENRLLDLIEIDAASNTSVDDVRELRDRIAFAPNEARYKVYVIDEVHMLSSSAFNALLKTLEEPPEHVIFILATTEPHKIPATVLSRCQRFDFHRIGAQEIAAHLQEVAQREGVTISTEALAVIARSATGSMRDALSLLDQITAYGHVEIDAELVREVLGMVSGEAVSQLASAIAAGDPSQVLDRMHGLLEQGVDLNQLVVQLIDHLRMLLLLKVAPNAHLLDVPAELLAAMKPQAAAFQTGRLVQTIRALNEAALALKTPFAGYLPVELALLDAVGLHATQPVKEEPAPATAAPAVAQRAPSLATDPVPSPSTPSNRSSATAPGPPRPTPVKVSRTEAGGNVDLEQLLARLVQHAGTYSPKLQAVLRSGRLLAKTDSELIIAFQHSFHLQTTQQDSELLSKVVTEVTGQSLAPRPMMLAEAERYVASLHKQGDAAPAAPQEPSPSDVPAEDAEDPLLRMAMDEFGAEVTAIEPKQD